MSFPVFVDTYCINGRNYRRPAYRPPTKVAKFEDTPDLYDIEEDEPTTGCFAPKKVEEKVKKDMKKKKDIGKKEVDKNDTNSDEPQDTEDPRVKVINGKKWVAMINVPSALIGKFIGTNRRPLKTLEDETQCRVKTPRKEQHKPCEITSLNGLESVQRCLDRIEIFLVDAKKTARPTHFIALPCDQKDVMESFEMFKTSILEGDHFDKTCKNPKLFTSPSRLHLTLAVTTVFDDVEMNQIVELFGKLEKDIRQILSNKPLSITIEGIEMMNDDPANVSVIFAKIRGAKVQEIANLVRNEMVKLGLAKSDENDVLLHMTLMNGRYVAQAENKKNYNFDATKILEDFADFHFGSIDINDIALCPLNSNTPSTKFYPKMATIQLA